MDQSPKIQKIPLKKVPQLSASPTLSLPTKSYEGNPQFSNRLLIDKITSHKKAMNLEFSHGTIQLSLHSKARQKQSSERRSDCFRISCSEKWKKIHGEQPRKEQFNDDNNQLHMEELEEQKRQLEELKQLRKNQLIKRLQKQQHKHGQQHMQQSPQQSQTPQPQILQPQQQPTPPPKPKPKPQSQPRPHSKAQAHPSLTSWRKPIQKNPQKQLIQRWKHLQSRPLQKPVAPLSPSPTHGPQAEAHLHSPSHAEQKQIRATISRLLQQSQAKQSLEYLTRFYKKPIQKQLAISKIKRETGNISQVLSVSEYRPLQATSQPRSKKVNIKGRGIMANITIQSSRCGGLESYSLEIERGRTQQGSRYGEGDRLARRGGTGEACRKNMAVENWTVESWNTQRNIDCFYD